VLFLPDSGRELGEGRGPFLERELGEGRALDDDETTIAPPPEALDRSFRSDESFFFFPQTGTMEYRS
jgi:hypothetical protein